MASTTLENQVIEDGPDCCVCLDVIQKDAIVKVKCCGQTLCSLCLQRCLELKPNCPHCRQTINIRGEKISVFADIGFNSPDEAANIAALVTKILDDSNPEYQIEYTQRCRRLLSRQQDPPIQAVIDTGIVPKLIEFLRRDQTPQLQFEAAWTLTNIASGNSDQTQTVVQAGAVPVFVQLLSTPSLDVQEQAAWALGNIAGDNAESRDFVISQGALPALLDYLKRNEEGSVTSTRNGGWFLSNLCRGKNPSPNFESICEAIPTLVRLLNHSDTEVVTDACWSLSYLSDGENGKITEVLKHGVAKRLVELLSHPSETVKIPALRTVGNILSGDNEHTDEMLKENVLPPLKSLMASTKESIRKEACWAISNITAGTPDQIEQVIKAQFIKPLLNVMKSGCYRPAKEAAWAICNATSAGTPEQIKRIVDMEYFEIMISKAKDANSLGKGEITALLLDSLENCLKKDSTKIGEGSFTKLFSEVGGLSLLKDLSLNAPPPACGKAQKILKDFFVDEAPARKSHYNTIDDDIRNIVK